MNETRPPRRLGRSLVALLAGMFAGILLSVGTDALLYAAGIFPALGQRVPDPLLLLATAYRTIYGASAATLQPVSPLIAP